jgi:hypothetical protein
MPPALIMSLILGSLYGLLFYALAGKSKRSVWSFWLVGALAFLVGQFVGDYITVSSITLGDVHVIEGSVACWVALFVLYNKK